MIRRVAVAALITIATACGSATGPGEACRTDGDFRVCIDRAEYPPGATVQIALTNRGSSVQYLDRCSIHLVSRANLRVFGSFYEPQRRCGSDVTLAEVVAEMRVVGPGETHIESVPVPSGIPQGFYTIRLWRLDETGMLLTEEPVSTPEFDVFPSAG